MNEEAPKGWTFTKREGKDGPTVVTRGLSIPPLETEPMDKDLGLILKNLVHEGVEGALNKEKQYKINRNILEKDLGDLFGEDTKK